MHLLIEAMPSILREHPDTTTVIVGGVHAREPNYSAELRQQISNLGLDGRVIIAGFQSNVPLWMQAMDVVVHASDCEPFGIVLIEAMALGKPVVATNRGGPLELITDDVDGLLWESGNVKSLARQVLRCLEEPGLSSRLGRKAAVRARHFSSSGYARRLTETFATLAVAAGK